MQTTYKYTTGCRAPRGKIKALVDIRPLCNQAFDALSAFRVPIGRSVEVLEPQDSPRQEILQELILFPNVVVRVNKDPLRSQGE
jgi:hypothetical protein